jgi:hypothetical protein
MARFTHFLFALIATFSLAGLAAATVVTDEFDYGADSPDVGLAGLGDSTGPWDGAWGSGDVGYNATNLTYSATGYVNGPATSGSAGPEGASATGNRRHFNDAGNASDVVLSGSVWGSWLTQASADGSAWFEFNNNARAYFGIRFWSGQQKLYGRWGEGSDYVTFDEGTFTPGENHLIVFNVDVDAVGTGDALRVWVNPGDVSSEAALGPATYTNPGWNGNASSPVYYDAFGTGLHEVQASVYQGTTTSDPNRYARLDALRLSDEGLRGAVVPFGFQDDQDGAAVPEPVSALLVSMAGLAALTRRSRR